MGQHGQKGRSRFLKPARFGHVFGELLRCARRSCGTCAPIGVTAPHHNTRPAPSHIPKPRLTVSTVAHSPAPSNCARIILTAPRTSLKRTSCSPLMQGGDASSLTKRYKHRASFSGTLLFKCDSSAGLGDTVLCALARPRLHSLASSALGLYPRPWPRQPLHLRPIPPHSHRVFFTVAPQGHIMRVHRRTQLFSGLIRFGSSRGS